MDSRDNLSNKKRSRTFEYTQGRRARRGGEAKASDNPYPCESGTPSRVDWFNGWYDENTRIKLRGIVRDDWPKEVED